MIFEEKIRENIYSLLEYEKIDVPIEIYFTKYEVTKLSKEDYDRIDLVFHENLWKILKEKGYLLTRYSFELKTGKFVFEYTINTQ